MRGVGWVAVLVACGSPPAPVADPGRELAPLQGAWPRPARTKGVCAGSRGFEVARGDSPTGFLLIDRTQNPERSFRIEGATRQDSGVLELEVQRDGHPLRRLDIRVEDASGRATVTWIDPSRPPFALVSPIGARGQPVKPCPP